METPLKKAGRRAVPVEHRKKNRGLSFTDSEYERLCQLAADAGFHGPSAYLVHHHKLTKN